LSLEEAKPRVLVLLGVRADGRKELITLHSGYRESGESWASLLRDAARRGMRAPVLAVGDGAEDLDHARAGLAAFTKQYSAKLPKTVAKLTDDERELLAFYDCPAEHWVHLRTTNPIESTFCTVRLRTTVNCGAGSRAAALAMTFKLIESAQDRWRAVNAPRPVALMRAGARFERGIPAGRDTAVGA
jgi:putative transposase